MGPLAPIRPAAPVRGAVTAVLGLMVLVTAVMGAAAILEKWGSRFGRTDTLELALDIQPWRITTSQRLGRQLSTQVSLGDAETEVRADAVAERVVRDHPWDPVVRWWAASVEVRMGHTEHAFAWFDEQEERFPAEIELINEARAQVRAEV